MQQLSSPFVQWNALYTEKDDTLGDDLSTAVDKIIYMLSWVEYDLAL